MSAWFVFHVEEIRIEFDEQHTFQMIDLASVRAVHGPAVNRMTKKEVIPHVTLISFCPHVTNVLCATGPAVFQLYEIDHQNMSLQTLHFRAEFYVFTCHCWLDANSILVRLVSVQTALPTIISESVQAITDHGHIFWIQDGSIRSDISLEAAIGVSLSSSASNTGLVPSKSSMIQAGERSWTILHFNLFECHAHVRRLFAPQP